MAKNDSAKNLSDLIFGSFFGEEHAKQFEFVGYDWDDSGVKGLEFGNGIMTFESKGESLSAGAAGGIVESDTPYAA